MVLDVHNIFPTAQNAADEFFVQEAEERLTPRFVIKAVTERVEDSSAFQDDDELFMSVSADSVYEFEVFLATDQQSSLRDPKITFIGPTGSIGKFWATVVQDSISTTFDPKALTETLVFNMSDTADHWQSAKGWIKTANSAGNLQLQWAVNSASDWVDIDAGSWLKVTRQ